MAGISSFWMILCRPMLLLDFLARHGADARKAHTIPHRRLGRVFDAERLSAWTKFAC
jgi:hypothetical protein